MNRSFAKALTVFPGWNAALAASTTDSKDVTARSDAAGREPRTSRPWRSRSVSHSRLLLGNQSNPPGDACAEEITGDDRGLSLGVVPSSLIRRIFPEYDAELSAVGQSAAGNATYSFRSGPIRIEAVEVRRQRQHPQDHCRFGEDVVPLRNRTTRLTSAPFRARPT